MKFDEITVNQQVQVAGQGMWRPVVTHKTDSAQGQFVRVADSRGNSQLCRPEDLSPAN